MFIEIRLWSRMIYVFKDHVKIVQIYMVKFNVSILNRLKTMFFFVNTKYICKYNVSLNKTVTKLYTILTKKFFPYLNPTSYLNTVPSQSTLISQEVFHDNQVNLENTANLNSSL